MAALARMTRDAGVLSIDRGRDRVDGVGRLDPRSVGSRRGPCHWRVLPSNAAMLAVAWAAIGLLAATLGVLSAALFRLDSRIDGLQSRLSSRMDRLEARIDAQGPRIDQLADGVGELTGAVAALPARFDADLARHAG